MSKLIANLGTEFTMKDLGPLHYFLGIEVTYFEGGMFLSQSKYALDLLSKSKMHNARPIGTPLSLTHHLYATSFPIVDATSYQSVVGALRYLTLTRPDITHVVNLACQFLSAPNEGHYQAVKRILQYVKGTLHYGLRLVS